MRRLSRRILLEGTRVPIRTVILELNESYNSFLCFIHIHIMLISPKFMTASTIDPTGKSIKCASCGKLGHMAGSCPEVLSGKQKGRKFRPLEKVQCFKCGKKGHYANMCTNERARPPPGGWMLPKMKAMQNR